MGQKKFSSPMNLLSLRPFLFCIIPSILIDLIAAVLGHACVKLLHAAITIKKRKTKIKSTHRIAKWPKASTGLGVSFVWSLRGYREKEQPSAFNAAFFTALQVHSKLCQGTQA